RMPTEEPSGGQECPFVPLHSETVLVRRGDRIRAERERRGLTREQLAEATGVNAKTIARIERGEVSSSPSTARLETHLGIPHPGAAHPPPKPSLADVSDLDLIAELARRLAERRADNSPGPHFGPEGYYRWPASAAPYPEPDSPGTAGDQGVAGSNERA